MTPFKHAYMLLATDFELEPVIEQYLSTYPDVQPRNYQVVCKLQNERIEGDYCYIILYEHANTPNRPKLQDYIKSYCEVHDKVAHIEKGGNVFPDLAEATFGDRTKYRKLRDDNRKKKTV